MKQMAFGSKTARQTKSKSQQDSSTGKNAVSIGPPDYGINFVDSDQAAMPLQKSSGAGSHTTTVPNIGHNFSHIPIHTRPEAKAIAIRSEHHASLALQDKSVNGESDNRVGLVEDKGPDGGTGPKDAGPPAGVSKKKAGVESFEVKWTKNPISGPKTAKLRLDYSAKFKKDATHDPTVAEFRQNAFHTFEVTAGPYKGQKHDNPPLHDDNYSRADDTAGNTINDVNFVSNDNPGTVENHLDKNDVIDYSFTAEQMIIDTSDGNKEIAKRGPHTATIKGKDPRKFDGVPKTFS
ncbi:MAG TPA: hypothetical protein VMX36_11610 [Sedimentisphaerales bacterium]|nr:hypothetical protein [Sedimentisphaerales bacterium]